MKISDLQQPAGESGGATSKKLHTDHCVLTRSADGDYASITCYSATDSKSDRLENSYKTLFKGLLRYPSIPSIKTDIIVVAAVLSSIGVHHILNVDSQLGIPIIRETVNVVNYGPGLLGSLVLMNNYGFIPGAKEGIDNFVDKVFEEGKKKK